MAKGKDKHQHRLDELNLLGKDLARRSHSQCELCGASGVKLLVHEVEPVPAMPDLEHALFACEVCKEQLDNPKRVDADHWRCLSSSVWSEVPAVQVQAVQMLVSLKDHDWAADLMDQLYLTPEIIQWLESVGVMEFSAED